MRRHRSLAAVLVPLAGLALLFCPTPTASSQDPDPTKVPPLMQMKLEHTRNIMEGLTLEDYEKVASSARSLRLLSMESGWNVYQTKSYRAQSQAFRQATQLMSDAAADKDINRASLGYISMTIRCVDCHTYIRKNKVELTSVPAAP